MDSAIMLSMLGLFFGIVIFILYATKQKGETNFDEYAVGGRAYGPWFVAMSYVNSWWPGSTYIAFFGMAAGAGVFGLYGLAYSTLGVAFMYFMASRAWRWGKAFNLRTQPDLLGYRFNSPTVKVIASVIGVVCVFPWVVLGMQALGTLLQVATGFTISVIVALVIGIVLIMIRQIWTVTMGMRGLIMTDMFQGAVAYVVAAAVCVVMLTGAFGSPISFADLSTTAEQFLRVPGDGDAYGPLYLASLIFTGVIGSLCWPMSFQRIYTAKSVRSTKAATLRTILISATFYTLLMLVGIAATKLPAVVEAPQSGWFTLLELYGGSWMLGLAVVIVFAAAMGHIDGSIQVCGLQIANDVVGHFRPSLTDAQLTKVAKTSMVVFMAAASVVAYLTFDMERLQLLAQMSYQGIIQLAVPLFAGIFWRGGNKYGAISGMAVGFTIAAALTWVFPDDIASLGSITGGIIGLVVNLATFLLVSAVTKTDARDIARAEAMFAAAKQSQSVPAEKELVNA